VTQLALIPDPVEIPRPAVRRKRAPTLQERFNTFHGANPHVYHVLVDLAREAKDAGRTRVGMKEIYEVARWRLRLKTKGDEFRLNNSYTSLYARLIVDTQSDLADMFEMRRRRA